MVGRFSDRARLVVLLAEEEARALGHGHIGTEHLLLGLLSEERSLAARALRSLRISLHRVRTEVVRAVGLREGEVEHEMHFSERAKDTLEQALRRALADGQASIEPEHILIGLTYQGAGVAERILSEMRVDPEQIIEAVAHAPFMPTEPPRRRDALKRANEIRSWRAQLKRDLKRGRIDPADLIRDPPPELLTAKLFDFMLSVPKYGRVKVDRLLKHCQVAPGKTFGGLTERQREDLMKLLGGRSRQPPASA